MWATDSSRRAQRLLRHRQAGTAAVEFALLAIVFFTFVFGVIEISRLMYVYNTLQVVTRRAAAAAAQLAPTDSTGLAAARQHAVFRDTPGALMLAPPVTDEYIRISYLNFDLSVIPQNALPESPARNRERCTRDPYADDCIRFVQAEICDPDTTGSCVAATSQMILPFVDLRMPLHKATTIVLAESLGYVPGTLP